MCTELPPNGLHILHHRKEAKEKAPRGVSLAEGIPCLPLASLEAPQSVLEERRWCRFTIGLHNCKRTNWGAQCAGEYEQLLARKQEWGRMGKQQRQLC